MNRITISKGKRAKKSNNRKKTVGIIIFIIIIILLIIILKYKIDNQDNSVVSEEPNIQFNMTLDNLVEEPPVVVKQDEIVSTADFPKTMTSKTKVSYNVIGKIVIDKIGVEKYILDRTTENSLDLAVTYFQGEERKVDINTVGNFCIMGHNYPGIFKKLEKLEIGDEFYLIGADGRKVTYVIYEKFSKVDPNNKTEVNEKMMNQETNGKRIVTLITCEPGATKRLILKSEEKII